MPKKQTRNKEASGSKKPSRTKKATKPKKTKKNRKAQAPPDRAGLDSSQDLAPTHSSEADDPLNLLRGMPMEVQAAFDPNVAQPNEPGIDPSQSSDPGANWHKLEGLGTLTCTGSSQGSWFFLPGLGWKKVADTNVALAILANSSNKSGNVKIKEINGLITEIYISREG